MAILSKINLAQLHLVENRKCARTPQKKQEVLNKVLFESTLVDFFIYIKNQTQSERA